MQTIAKLGVITFAFSVLFFSCKKSEAPLEEITSATPNQENNSISSTSALEQKGENRKFIRTADIKFKAKNVTQSTYAIENATRSFGGYVSYTNLQSAVLEQIKTKISQDSIMETTTFSIENNMTIRVPNTKLDTLLKTISKQIVFLDYRLIKADDVSIEMIKNQLIQNRKIAHQNRLKKAIDTKGKKLNDIATAENEVANQKEQSDISTIENVSLQDQVNFSTLKLELYQNKSIKQERIANSEDLNSYQTNIGIESIDALKNGWYMLKEIIVFFINLWALFLIGGFIFIAYKKYLRKKSENC
jgi:Domain of unknown function (DUF4349)